jgi:Ca-activated chloride channel family protein
MQFRVPLRAAALTSLLLAGVHERSFAQTTTEQPYNVNISVGYVMVPFVPLDSHGRAVRNLRGNEIKLSVDGRAIKTDLFEKSENAPVSFTILLDGSGSMGLAGKKQAALSAIAGLVNRHIKGDDYSLYVFSEGEVRELVPFTTDGGAIYEAARQLKPWGKTAFYDALAMMPDKTILGQNGSRAIILLTDALDNASTMTRGQLTAAMYGVDVPVYPLGMRLAMIPRNDVRMENAELLSDAETLQQIAALTGGRFFVGTQASEIASAVAEIENDLRTQYLVGFTPTGRGGVKYRAISLRLPRSVKVVRVRAGYRGTEPPFVPTAAEARANKSKKAKRSQ